MRVSALAVYPLEGARAVPLDTPDSATRSKRWTDQ